MSSGLDGREPYPAGGSAAIGRRDVLLAAAVGLVTSGPRFAMAASPNRLTWGRPCLARAHVVRACRGVRHHHAVHGALCAARCGGQTDARQGACAKPCRVLYRAEDGRSHDFVLRGGARFHNGDPVTSADVKFSFERYRGVAHDLLQARVEAVETPDARQVRFRLKAPWPDFLTFYATATGGPFLGSGR
jgi:peptide/nickel transport system substrate-binding protein